MNSRAPLPRLDQRESLTRRVVPYTLAYVCVCVCVLGFNYARENEDSRAGARTQADTRRIVSPGARVKPVPVRSFSRVDPSS